MPKVFVTQEPIPTPERGPLDFSDAERFGKLVFLTRDDLVNARGSLQNQWLIKEIAKIMRDYDPEEDWLLIAGSPYVAAVVMALIGSKGVDSIRMLRWTNRDRRYMPMFLDFDGVLSDNIGNRDDREPVESVGNR